jgi:ElaB/YqjD/DUF883 family membrane-anchored ribosome-binding protein
VEESEMSDQQDTWRGDQATDDVVGSTSGWDTPGLGREGSGQGMPASFEGQPPEERGQTETQGQSGGMMETAREKAGQVTEQAGAMLDTAKDRATQMTDQATSAVDTGMDKAASGLDTVAGTLRDRGESMGSGSMGSLATTAADKMEAGAQILREKDTEQILSDLEALVRRRPVESLLVAAGIGFVLSKIVR